MTFPFTQGASGGCVDGIEYFVNTELQSFDLARQACQSIGEGVKLAIPFSEDRHTEMQRVLRLDIVGEVAYIGLFDPNGNRPDTNGERFLDIDGQLNPLTSTPNLGDGIWFGNQPSGDEVCVVLDRTDSDTGIADLNCNLAFPSICQQFCEAPSRELLQLSECVAGVQLYLFENDTAKSFDEAQAHCEEFDVEGHLAVPADAQEFVNIRTFFTDFGGDNGISAYLGFANFKKVEGRFDTARFQSVVTGQAEAFTNVARGIFPWDGGQPDGDGQDCVELPPGPRVISDIDCFQDRRYICQRPCTPTSSPTSNPSAKPTTSPTINPSPTPTKGPTSFPTGPTTVASSSDDSSTAIILGTVCGVYVLFAIIFVLSLYRKKQKSSPAVKKIKANVSDEEVNNKA